MNEFENMRGCNEIPMYMGTALSLLAKDTSLIPKLNATILSKGSNETNDGFVKGFSAAVTGLPMMMGDSAYCFVVGRAQTYAKCKVGMAVYLNGFVRANLGFNSMNNKIDKSVKDDSVTLKVVTNASRDLLSFSMLPGEIIVPPGIKYIIKEVNVNGNWILLEEEGTK